MATIKDVAKKAGVSVATVSHVVNKTRYVSPELSQKVEDAIKSLDSMPNFIAKKDKSRGILPNTQYLLFLAPDLHDGLTENTLHALEGRAREEGFCLIPFEYGEDADRMDFCQYLLTTIPRIKGVFLMAEGNKEKISAYLQGISCPVVQIGAPLEGVSGDVVHVDFADGAEKAINCLVRRGHTGIAVFTDKTQPSREKEILSGVMRALEKHGTSFFSQYCVSCSPKRSEIFKRMQELMHSEMRPSAILVSNSRILRGILSYLKMEALECPKDVSIVSTDDYDHVKYYSPPITNLTQNTKRLAENAYRLMRGRIENDFKALPAQHVILPYLLSVRASALSINLGPFGEPAAPQEAAILDEKEKAKVREGNYTAVISFHSTSRAFMQLVERGLRSVFDMLNIKLLAITDAQFDSGMQRKQIEGLLNLQPDLFFSMPTDSFELADVYKRIVNSPSQVVFIGDNIPNGLTPDDYVTCVSASEYSIGQCIGNAIGEYMRRNNMSRIGFIIHGQDGFYKSKQRDTTVRQVLEEEYTGIEIVGTALFEQEDSYQVTRELIEAHPEIEMLYISWERPATYSLNALADLGRSDISIITMDLDYEVAMNMAQGKEIKAICGEHPYEIGRVAAYAGAGKLIGKEIPSFFGHPSTIITYDNLLKSWNDTFLTPPPPEMTEAVNQTILLHEAIAQEGNKA